MIMLNKLLYKKWHLRGLRLELISGYKIGPYDFILLKPQQ